MHLLVLAVSSTPLASSAARCERRQPVHHRIDAGRDNVAARISPSLGPLPWALGPRPLTLGPQP